TGVTIGNRTTASRIDHIFISNNLSQFLSSSWIDSASPFFSDHFPISTHFLFPNLTLNKPLPSSHRKIKLNFSNSNDWTSFQRKIEHASNTHLPTNDVDIEAESITNMIIQAATESFKPLPPKSSNDPLVNKYFHNNECLKKLHQERSSLLHK